MEKDVLYLMLIIGGISLWMLGGWKSFWIFHHNKLLRRLYWPSLIAGIALKVTGLFYESLITLAAAIISFSLPYGKKSSWLVNAITALSYGCFSLALGMSPIQFLPPAVFLLFYAGSRWNSDIFHWKVCEGATGFAIAWSVADLLSKYCGG